MENCFHEMVIPFGAKLMGSIFACKQFFETLIEQKFYPQFWQQEKYCSVFWKKFGSNIDITE